LLAEAKNAEARLVAEVRAVNAEVEAKRGAAHVLDKLLAEDSKAPEPDDENGNDDPENADEDAPAPADEDDDWAKSVGGAPPPSE